MMRDSGMTTEAIVTKGALLRLWTEATTNHTSALLSYDWIPTGNGSPCRQRVQLGELQEYIVCGKKK
jgi:hypothetical protein